MKNPRYHLYYNKIQKPKSVSNLRALPKIDKSDENSSGFETPGTIFGYDLQKGVDLHQ
jgi:hypothetical protein